MIRLSPLEKTQKIRHAFFTREGGVSEGIYAGLNCGPGSGDEQEKVVENQRLAMERLGVAPDTLHLLHQVHSATVEVLDGPRTSKDARPKADGMVTREANVAIGILTADCAPVLFADHDNYVIGAAHAGWRGALGGILEATIEAMESKGAKRENITAAIGPCITQASYEVGADFFEEFVSESEENVRFFIRARKPGKMMFDLPGYIGARLGNADIGFITFSGGDTVADEQRFFSYRRSVLRGEDGYGRALSAISLV